MLNLTDTNFDFNTVNIIHYALSIKEYNVINNELFIATVAQAENKTFIDKQSVSGQSFVDSIVALEE